MNARQGNEWITIALIVGASASLGAQSQAQNAKFEVVLKTAWVQAHADRATIDASMDVHWAHKAPNKIGSDGDDGDMHFSGESPDIGLPLVAEIVNAKNQLGAVQEMKASQVSKQPLAITGAWRLWFEHPANTQTQGGQNAFLPDNTNPNHSFEIHPVSKVGTHSVATSFVPIPGYTAYTAEVAFPYFDQCTVTIKASGSAIAIRSKKLKYNYVQFTIELTRDPQVVPDGTIVFANIMGNGDELVTEGERRIIVVSGTSAATAIHGATKGDRFTVLGIPRVSLSGVLALVQAHGTQQFDASLPYEMIAVGAVRVK